MGTYLGKHPIGAIVPLAYKYVEQITTQGESSVELNNALKLPIRDLQIQGNSIYKLLPVEYQEVEYLENSGTQRIDVGLIPTNSTSIDITYQSMQPTGTSQYIAGSRVNAGATLEYIINGSSSSTYWDVRLGGVTTTLTNTSRMSEKIRSSLQLNNGSGTWTLTRVTAGTTYTKTISSAKVNATANLFLFAYNNLDTNTHINLRIFACKIYESGVIVRNFVPCYRKSDNVKGLYDLVTNEFYTNAGAGSFIVGADVESTPSLEQPVKIISVGEKTKNILDVSKAETGSLVGADGSDFASTNRARTPFVYVKKGTYTISMNSDVKATTMFFYSQPASSGYFISKYVTSPTVENGIRVATFPVEKDCYMRCVFVPEDESKTTDLSAETLKNYNVMIEEVLNLFDITKAQDGSVATASGTDYASPDRCRTDFIYLTKGSYYFSCLNNIQLGGNVHKYTEPNQTSWIGAIPTGQLTFDGTKTIRTFELDEDCYIRLVILPVANSGVSLDLVFLKTCKPFLVKLPAHSDYEPYGYKIPITIYEENLANENTILENKLISSAAIGNIVDSTTYNTVYAEVEQGRTYVFKNFVRADGTTLRGCFYDSNGAWVSAIEDTTVTIPSGVKYVGRSFNKEAKDVGLYLLYSTTNIYLNEPLRKVDDVADILDYKNKKVIRNVGSIVYNATESWSKYDSGNGYMESNTIFIDGKPVLCNMLVYSDKLIKTLAIRKNYANIYAYGVQDYYPTQAEWHAFLSKNPMEVIGQLVTPTEELINVDIIKPEEGYNKMTIDTKIEPNSFKIVYLIDADI